MPSQDSEKKPFFRARFAALVAALALAAAGASAAPTETVLYSFCSKPGCSDGAIPVGGLIADSSGNLYGTTAFGGGSGCGGFGCGVVFKLAPNGTETVLHAFTGGSGGAGPRAGLIFDSSGNLYGTTQVGGAPGCVFGTGCGVVFKLASDGTETVLHSFTGGSDGANPFAGLIADSKGNLYGTADGGAHGVGVVFKLAPDGTETVLHSFTGGSDGFRPLGGLIFDSAGNLYGTAGGGGAGECFGGPACGVVFKVAPDGTETVLHSFTGNSFTGGSDGAFPLAGLIGDSSGNLYGTTESGGLGACFRLALNITGCGVVFKFAPDGTETVLHSFTDSFGGAGDGASPQAGLIADGSGYLYGTTEFGGVGPCGDNGFGNGCGVVFKLAPGGTETVLDSFCSQPICSDGANPVAGLIADGSGNLYGTTSGGGAHGDGVVFKLAGTGFVTTTPFLAFKAKLEIDLDRNPKRDSFELHSSFTLKNTASIHPSIEPVTLSVGTFTTTIPPGSFKKDRDGDAFKFEGKINGVRLEASIELTGTLRYAFNAEAARANLAGTKNLVPVSLTIGDDRGTTTVKAEFDDRSARRDD